MNTLLIYMVKAAVYMSAFYLVYSLVLSRDTAYGRNRAYLLLSLALSLIFPVIAFQTVKPLNIQFFGKFLSDVFISANTGGVTAAGSVLPVQNSLQIIYTIYIIGVSVSLLKLIIDFTHLLFLIVRHKNKGSRIIRFNGFSTSGFSALGYIFINTRLNPEEAGEIIKHEQNHLRQNHFLDIIFIEIVKSFQWFNPIIYMLNTALRAIHEFQADNDCLKSGMPVVNYQSLLLSQVFKSRAFNLTNSFSNPSLIKRRMVMMTKKRTSAIANMKLLLVLPVTAVIFFAISAYKEIPSMQEKQQVPQSLASYSSTVPSDIRSNATFKPVLTSVKQIKASSKTEVRKTVSSPEKKDVTEILPSPPPPPPPPVESAVENVKEETVAQDEVPFIVVEQMPMFPGGDQELLKYIYEHVIYPQNSRDNNEQGRVIVRFCVTAKGGVSQASILKGVSPGLNAEAIRVVNTLPEFLPGKQGGKPVPVWYMVPITFTLK